MGPGGPVLAAAGGVGGTAMLLPSPRAGPPGPAPEGLRMELVKWLGSDVELWMEKSIHGNVPNGLAFSSLSMPLLQVEDQ